MTQDEAANKVLFELIERGLLSPSVSLTVLPYLYRLVAVGFDIGISYTTQKTPVTQYTKEGVFIRSFDSLIDAERKTGVDHSNISKVIDPKTPRVTAGGYGWKSAKGIKEKIIQKQKYYGNK